MSFLSDEEIAGLHVERMIIHLVGKRIEFRPEAETAVQQQEFFQSRIIDHAASAVHTFTEHSNVRPVLQLMGTGDMGFEVGGQELARLFWRDHTGQSTPGAFFVFRLSTGIDGTILFALIKYDYRPVVELAQQGGQNVLREIIQAFVKEKRAVQKFCVVRFRAGAIEDEVSATDRMADAPDLTDYFETYLGVSRARSIQELSTRLNEAMRGSLQELREHLPHGDVAAALVRAKQALQGRGIVTNEDIVDAILHGAERPRDEKVVSRIGRVTRGRLKRSNLTDVEFRPDPARLAVRPRRKVRTAEGARLEYPEDELGRSVTRVETQAGTTFTIHTAHKLVEDDTVAIRTS